MTKSTGAWKLATTVAPGSMRARDDDAVDRRVDLRPPDVRLRLRELRLDGADLRLGGGDLRLRDLVLAVRRVELALAREVLLEEALRSLEGDLRGGGVRLRALEVARAARRPAPRPGVTCAPYWMGSISARRSPFFTTELKSTYTFATRPLTCEPTFTWSTGCTAPVACTFSATSPVLGRGRDVASRRRRTVLGPEDEAAADERPRPRRAPRASEASDGLLLRPRGRAGRRR